MGGAARPAAGAAADGRAPFRTLGIVGVGLIGGSLAAAVRSRWPEARIVGVDRPVVLADAQARGWIHESRSSASSLADADLVVLAAPIPQIVEAVIELRSAGGAVTDVGSTKRRILRTAAHVGLRGFVGGHPMAGAEGRGLAGARADLFEGRPWFVVPGEGAPAGVVARVEALAAGVGAVACRVEAETHDRVMAYVSHLPQLLAVALMNVAAGGAGPEGLAMAGRAFGEMTRLAASPAGMWQGILASNDDYIAEALEGLRRELDALGVERPGSGQLAETFDRAAAFHRRLPKGAP